MARASRPVLSILEEEGMASFKSLDDTVCVAYADKNHQHVKINFEILAAWYHDQFTFGIVEVISNTYKGIEPGCIVCYRSEDPEEWALLCGQTKLETLESFLKTVTASVVGDLTRRSELKYLKVYSFH